MWGRIKSWFQDETKYKALTALGAIIVALGGGTFEVIKLIVDHKPEPPTSTISLKENKGLLTSGTTTINGGVQVGPTPDQMRQIQAPQLDEIEAWQASNKSLIRLLDRARTTSLFPHAEETLQSAITDLAAKAPHEARYKEALVLLRKGRVKDAEPLLLEVASDKAASTKNDDDKTTSGEAYKDLAAIAGLVDPNLARSAYQSAIYFMSSDNSLVSEYSAYSAANSPTADIGPSGIQSIPGIKSEKNLPHQLAKAEFIDYDTKMIVEDMDYYLMWMHQVEVIVHVCPPGYALGGISFSLDAFLCRIAPNLTNGPTRRDVLISSQIFSAHYSIFVDGWSLKYPRTVGLVDGVTMHVCPREAVLIGADIFRDLFICQEVATGSLEAAYKHSPPSEVQDGVSSQMRICNLPGSRWLMSGFDERANILSCSLPKY